MPLPPLPKPGAPFAGVPTAPKRSLVVVLAAVVVLALLALAWFVDRPLALELQQGVTPAWRKIARVYDDLGDSEKYLIVALVLYIWSLVGMRRGWTCPIRAGFDRVARCSLFLIVTMAISGLATWILKMVVARSRPELLHNTGFYGLGDMYSGDPFDSFPSSHTLTAFAVAFVIGAIAPRLRILAVVLAFGVAFARMAIQQHFLSDVLASACIAWAIATYMAPRMLSPAYTWPVRTPWRWWQRR